MAAGRARAARWGVTIGATVLSTWVLDVVATASGVVLVWTGLLADRAQHVLVALLVSSYALWALGLAHNLRANGRLLVVTGTSTNALSKFAFDVVRTRTDRERPARRAAAFGYVVTEVAKEAPYYAAAFGAAAVSDGVDGSDALVFLVGANLGAALYEGALAHLTGVLLDGRERRARRRVPGRAAPSSDTVNPRPIRGRSIGRTADFGSANRGSIPLPGAMNEALQRTDSR